MFVFFPSFSILCFRDHPEATQQMNDLIIAKVSAALKGHWANPDLVSLRGHTENNLNPRNIVFILFCFLFVFLRVTVTMNFTIKKSDFKIHTLYVFLFFPHQVSNLQYEMLLLTDSISKEGGCWELRLRCGKP